MFKKFIGLIVVGLLVCVIPACSNNQDAKNDPVGVIMGNAGDREDDREMFDRDKDGIHWIHRKGATHAEKGMMGVIPGNMRDGSFIVRGKGNPESLYSSSHGAGRVLGRAKAKQTIDFSDFEVTMKGIVANVSEDTKDESPFAYKDIFEVMRLQEDLVDVVAHVKPIINVKG